MIPPPRAPTLVVLVALLGCGMKGPPVAPELVQPLPVERLEASRTADGIRLEWRRPTHYSGGDRMRDLGRFEIERGPAEDGPRAYAVVHELVLTDQQQFQQARTFEWTDTDVAPDRAYWYRVTAITTDRYRSPPSEPVFIRTRVPRAADAPPAAADPS